MPVDITRTLRSALKRLNAEKGRIERQINALESALGTTDQKRGHASRVRARRKPGRRRMSGAARKAASRRMKAYWAKRKRRAGRGKARAA